MHFVKIAKVTSNYRNELIYIPKTVRERLGIRRGTYVKLYVEGRRLVIEPLELSEAKSCSTEFDRDREGKTSGV